MAIIWMGFEDVADGVRIMTNESRIEIMQTAKDPAVTTAAYRIVADLLESFCGISKSSEGSGGIAIH